jgi:hypothetical protein
MRATERTTYRHHIIVVAATAVTAIQPNRFIVEAVRRHKNKMC